MRPENDPRAISSNKNGETFKRECSLARDDRREKCKSLDTNSCQKAICWKVNACESSCMNVWHELRTRRGFRDHAETERTEGRRHGTQGSLSPETLVLIRFRDSLAHLWLPRRVL